MKRIQIVFLGLVWLLTACASATTEPPATSIDEPSVANDETVETETAVDEVMEAETAVKPQFIMFTAPW